MENFKPVLTEMGLEYGKNKIKKVWYGLTEEDRDQIVAGDLINAKNAICQAVMGEPWDEVESFQRRWREHTGQTKKEFEDLCAELEALI